jgi:hypothetical protein
MKPQTQQETSTSFSTRNRQLWLTFSVEETMNQPTKESIMKKVWLLFVAVLALLFSACIQQPAPEQVVESQGVNTWSFPHLTVDVGISAYHPVLAVTTNSSNAPIVAYKSSVNDALQVKRWLSNSWQNMGTQVNTSGTYLSGFGGVAMAKNGNNPVIAYIETTSSSYKLYVKRWNGSSWTAYGSGATLNINAAKYAYHPAVAVDASGYLVVAWTENVDTLMTKVYVKRWNGSSWDTLGTSGLLHGSQPQLAVGENGKVVLAYLKCISGDDFNCTNQDLYVSRWEASSNPIGFGFIWKTLGQTLESGAPSNPRLAIYNNEPVVAWLEDSGYLLVKRYGQACLQNACIPAWLNLGKGFGYAGAFSMGVNSSGEPILAVTACENAEFCTSYNLSVTRVVSKNNWNSVGASPLDTVANNDVRKPVLSVTGKTYTVAWLEFGSDASYSDIKLKQYSTLILQPF